MQEKEKQEESNYFSYFKKLYESWEKSTSQAVEIWLRSPLFRNNMERAVEKSIEFKNYIHDTMERNLKHKYIPMKNDVDKLTSSLKNLEQKLKRLEEKISNLESTRKPTREQKNTKIKEKNKQ
jgi:hypothetical protein